MYISVVSWNVTLALQRYFDIVLEMLMRINQSKPPKKYSPAKYYHLVCVIGIQLSQCISIYWNKDNSYCKIRRCNSYSYRSIIWHTCICFFAKKKKTHLKRFQNCYKNVTGRYVCLILNSTSPWLNIVKLYIWKDTVNYC